MQPRTENGERRTNEARAPSNALSSPSEDTHAAAFAVPGRLFPPARWPSLMAGSGCVDIGAIDSLRYVEREEARFAVTGRPEVTLTTFNGSIEVRAVGPVRGPGGGREARELEGSRRRHRGSDRAAWQSRDDRGASEAPRSPFQLRNEPQGSPHRVGAGCCRTCWLRAATDRSTSSASPAGSSFAPATERFAGAICPVSVTGANGRRFYQARRHRWRAGPGHGRWQHRGQRPAVGGSGAVRRREPDHPRRARQRCEGRLEHFHRRRIGSRSSSRTISTRRSTRTPVMVESRFAAASRTRSSARGVRRGASWGRAGTQCVVRSGDGSITCGARSRSQLNAAGVREPREPIKVCVLDDRLRSHSCASASWRSFGTAAA